MVVQVQPSILVYKSFSPVKGTWKTTTENEPNSANQESILRTILFSASSSISGNAIKARATEYYINLVLTARFPLSALYRILHKPGPNYPRPLPALHRTLLTNQESILLPRPHYPRPLSALRLMVEMAEMTVKND